MTMNPADLPASGFVDRLKNFIVAPQAEWDRIVHEPSDNIAGLYIAYVVPFALLSAVAGAVGAIVFSRFVPSHALIDAVFFVILAIALVFIAAIIANALAPLFDSQRDAGQAHKLAVYSAWPALAAGVFNALPVIAWFGIIGLYSLGLLFMGLPRLMGTPELKRIPYMALLLALTAVTLIVLSMLAQSARAALIALPVFAAHPPTVAAPERAGPNLNTEPLQRSADFRGPIQAERLEGFLPATLPGGYRRGAVSSTIVAGGAEARAEYTNGSARLIVVVSQLAGVGAVDGYVQRMDVRPSQRTETLEVRTESLHGRLISEETNTASGTVRYVVMGTGLALIAEGAGGATMDEARAALETLDIQRLEATLH